MKKLICAVMALVLCVGGFATNVYADDSVLTINNDSVSHRVSPTLYGLTLQDADGIVSNMVKNNSFENADSPDDGWAFNNLTTALSTTEGISATNPTYQTITVDGKGVVHNLGYTEIYDENSAYTADIGFKKDVKYDFSCYLKNIDFEGTISVYLDSKSNSKNINQLNISSLSSKKWNKFSTTFTSDGSEDGGIAIVFEGAGSIMFDFVSLVPRNSYGYGSDQWQYATLKPDMVDAVKNLSPSFICFGSSVDWKYTIGTLQDRIQPQNSNAMGYHEYFQLCKDLNAVAIPQINVPKALTLGTDDFENYAQEVLDLIEYANGYSQTSYWGSVRASNGQAQPFAIQYIYLTGENTDALSQIIKAKYPDVTVLLSLDELGYQNDILSATSQATSYSQLEANADVTNFSSYAKTFAKINATEQTSSLIWYNSQDLVLTPNYYTQMLFANNTGSEYITTQPIDENISQSVTVDQDKQILYIKLVNIGSKQNVAINLNGFDNINFASNLSIDNKYKSAANQPGKNYITPAETQLEFEGNTVFATLKKNSVNVIRITYGENTGGALYQLPGNIDYDTQGYTPTGLKIAIISVIVFIAIAAVGLYLAIKKFNLIQKINKTQHKIME